MARPFWLRLVAAACLPMAGACQSYRPLELSGVRQGARVRLTMDQGVPVRLREITVERATLVDGEAVGVKDGALVLSALWVEREGGVGTPGEAWTVSVPVSAVATLAERRVSWWRTAVFGAGIAAATALGWRAFGGGSGGDSGGNRPGQQL